MRTKKALTLAEYEMRLQKLKIFIKSTINEWVPEAGYFLGEHSWSLEQGPSKKMMIRTSSKHFLSTKTHESSKQMHHKNDNCATWNRDEKNAKSS